MVDKIVTENNSKGRSFQEQHEELQIILDSVPAWIFYKDKENCFLKVNKAFCDVMGLSKDELEGRSLFDIYPREHAEAYWKDDKDVMESGKPKRNILETMDYKGEKLWLRTDKIPYLNAQGNIIGIIGFTLDITAQKNAEDEVLATYEKEKRICQEKDQLLDQLKSALAKIRTLNLLLPVCAVCKKIRDENGRWLYMESYISSRTDTQFTHGYCPECGKKAFKDFKKVAESHNPRGSEGCQSKPENGSSG